MVEQNSNYQFIAENSNKQKWTIFIVSLLTLIVVVALVVISLSLFKENIVNSAAFSRINEFISNDIKNLTPLGMFYLSFTGSFFFFATPLEFLFFLSIKSGHPFFLSLFFVLAGMIPAYAVNYLVGLKFGGLILNFVSKKRFIKQEER